MTDIALQPVRRQGGRLADVAYERIADAMLTGGIAPGARLVMDELASQLDISRTPVRDALVRLEAEGLIAPAGRRGYVVRAVNDTDVADFYQAREAIEAFCAARVAELGEEAVARVTAAVDGVAPAGSDDPRAVYDANFTVHRAFVAEVGNPLLLSLFDDLWQRARGIITFADFVARGREGSTDVGSHAELLAALRESPERAGAAMRDHIRRGMRDHLDGGR